RTVAMAALGLAWAALLGTFMMATNSDGQVFVGAQIPLLFLTSIAALVFTKGTPIDEETVLRREEEALEKLKVRQATLKQDLARIEVDETQSLQIYGVAKSLAEALSWKEMAPRLTSGIQKIFGAYEFLLYAFDESSEWHLLHRRGGWAAEPPIRGHLPEE